MSVKVVKSIEERNTLHPIEGQIVIVDDTARCDEITPRIFFTEGGVYRWTDQYDFPFSAAQEVMSKLAKEIIHLRNEVKKYWQSENQNHPDSQRTHKQRTVFDKFISEIKFVEKDSGVYHLAISNDTAHYFRSLDWTNDIIVEPNTFIRAWLNDETASTVTAVIRFITLLTITVNGGMVKFFFRDREIQPEELNRSATFADSVGIEPSVLVRFFLMLTLRVHSDILNTEGVFYD